MFSFRDGAQNFDCSLERPVHAPNLSEKSCCIHEKTRRLDAQLSSCVLKICNWRAQRFPQRHFAEKGRNLRVISMALCRMVIRKFESSRQPASPRVQVYARLSDIIDGRFALPGPAGVLHIFIQGSMSRDRSSWRRQKSLRLHRSQIFHESLLGVAHLMKTGLYDFHG